MWRRMMRVDVFSACGRCFSLTSAFATAMLFLTSTSPRARKTCICFWFVRSIWKHCMGLQYCATILQLQQCARFYSDSPRWRRMIVWRVWTFTFVCAKRWGTIMSTTLFIASVLQCYRHTLQKEQSNFLMNKMLSFWQKLVQIFF